MAAGIAISATLAQTSVNSGRADMMRLLLRSDGGYETVSSISAQGWSGAGASAKVMRFSVAGVMRSSC
jgi:hypothetical protein